jgi:hypothetical protein
MACELPWACDDDHHHSACVPAADPLSNHKLRSAFAKLANLIVCTNAQTVANVQCVSARVCELAGELAALSVTVDGRATQGSLDELQAEMCALKVEVEAAKANGAALVTSVGCHAEQIRGIRDYIATSVMMDAQASRAHVATMNRFLGMPPSCGGIVQPGTYTVTVEVPVQVGDMAAPFFIREITEYTVRAPTPVEEVRRSIGENMPPNARVTVGGEGKPAHVIYVLRDEIEDRATLVATTLETVVPAGTEAILSPHIVPMKLAGKAVVSVAVTADELRVVYCI